MYCHVWSTLGTRTCPNTSSCTLEALLARRDSTSPPDSLYLALKALDTLRNSWWPPPSSRLQPVRLTSRAHESAVIVLIFVSFFGGT